MAKQPHIREHVKSLRISLELLSIDVERYWVNPTFAVHEEDCEFEDLDVGESECECNPKWPVYEQKHLEESGAGVHILSRALSNFPQSKGGVEIGLTTLWPLQRSGGTPSRHQGDWHG
jgi:hypothetical protein